MGDRIKFGPEWLRNLAPGTSGSNNQNAPPSPTSSGASAGPSGDNTVSSSTPGNIATGNTPNVNSPNTSKVLLAKLRYGREEMLALYDRTSDPPSELKYIEILYQPRGKPPLALNNTFEDDMRENMRSGPPVGLVSPAERFGLGRGGMGRGLNVSDGRGRPRMPFIRQPSTGRGSIRHHGSPKMPGYSGGADDDSALNLRSSWSASNGGNTPNRAAAEQPEWTPTKMFRSKRPGQSTNWRQTREEGEEWRSPDAGRSRSNQQEKWERDWGDRPTQDKQQSWNSNRRNWVGGDTQNEENLPEWAVDSAEACGGTFDSSGAFHGYSNDDTNLPKNQDTTYPLTRSHTHGSFARSKTSEESSDEWWSSEKAKKLSPKRFDASDVKFKKQTSNPDGTDGASDSIKVLKDTDQQESGGRKPLRNLESLESLESLTSSEPTENACGGISDDEKFNNKSRDVFKPKFSESNTFDALMRSDINLEEASDERGNFQSVMITPNNSLRQKHQNIVSSASEVPLRDRNSSKQGLLQLIQGSSSHQPMENEMRKHQSPEDKMVDDIFDMTLEEKDMLAKNQISSPLGNNQATPTSSAMSAMPQMQNPAMQLRLSSPVFATQSMMTAKVIPSGMQGMPSGLQGHPSGLQGLPANMQGLPQGLQIGGLPPTLQVAGMQPLGMQGPGNQPQGMQQSMQGNMQQSMQGPGMQSSGMQPGMQGSGMQGSIQPLQQVGITNSALNASLGLPIIGPGSNAMGMGMQGVPTPVMPNSGIGNQGMGAGLQSAMGGGQIQPGGSGIAFPNASGLPGMSSANTSLFLSQNSNNPSIGNTGDIPMPNHSNHGNHGNMYQMHGLQQSASQTAFGSSIYSNIIQQQPAQPPPNQQIAEQWYYEDPEKNIQGPFSSKDMYNWYRAGFFNPSLMVRRACDTHMRPLGSYGPVVPFSHIDIVNFPISGGFNRSPGPHESMLNSQQTLGLDNVMNVNNLNNAPPANSMQFGTVGLVANPPFAQPQPRVDSLWSQPSPSADLMWMQQAITRNDSRVNNLPMFFWDQQPSAIASNALLPEEIAKEMKTEDQILAQLRASQGMGGPQNLSFMGEQGAPGAPGKPDENYPPPTSATPNMEELQKLIQKDTLAPKPVPETVENIEAQLQKNEKLTKVEQTTEVNNQKVQQHQQQIQQQPVAQQPQQQQQQQQPPPQPQPPKPAAESKQAKQTKNESEKSAKNKESNSKTKNKKKDEKKDELENKIKEDDNAKAEKRSNEPSPAKSKKEDKNNKKELEKEKKEWLKEGFTIVKGSEKSANKDNKKKAEEAKVVEEAERKRKEEEKLAADEDKKRKQAETAKKQQENQQQQQQRQAAESVVKKAPWSAVANQSMFATSKDGLTLTEIQRLEREKKLEQIKEQQQMMQIIAQQQAAALAREQEMQAGLGWAKKKGSNNNAPGQSLAEIQAEARKQAAAAAAAVAAAAAAQALDEAAQPPVNNVPWGNAPNGGGFWDTQPNQPSKPETSGRQESPKAPEPKPKKKITLAPPKKETTPAVEFESWCTTVLTSWSAKIDVPTFVGFLKDIESPYEVKDYVKCYLGESKDSNDFARQFLERRSKLLRVGMVTPSDDLCSPAMAVNPRTISGSDYQEVKGKGKKTKKNKMLKVDARILGFSVTAAEDRINVGDIDTV